MRNTQRFLALASMTLAAGAIIGVGATAASAAPSADSTTTAVQDPPPGGNTGGGNAGGGGGGGGNTGGGGGGGGGNTGGGGGGGGGGNTGGPHGLPGSWGNGNWHGTFDGHRRNNNWVQSWVVDTYRSKKACNIAGWIGEKRNRWDDSDCYRVGGRNVKYILVAHEYGRRHR